MEEQDKKTLIINTYLPPRGRYTNQEYQEEVDILHKICEKYQDRPIIILGDLNIDLNKKLDSRAKYLADFLKSHSFREITEITQPTFRQHSGNGQSKIDYIMVNQHFLSLITRATYQPMDDQHLNTSSHSPLILTALVPITKQSQYEDKDKTPRLKWNDCNKNLYAETLEEHLSVDIQNPDPEITINYLIDSLYATADTAVPVKKTKPKKAPWNPTIFRAKQASKIAHAQWKAAGRPSEHPLAEQRAVARRHLRQAQRQQAAKEQQNNMDRLMNAHEYDD